MWLSTMELLIRSCLLLLLVSSALLHCEVICELCVLAVWNLFWYWGFDNEPVAEHCPSIVIFGRGLFLSLTYFFAYGSF